MRHTVFPALASIFSLAVSFSEGCANDPPDLPDLPSSPPGSYLAVATSDFTTGALHTVNLSTREVQKQIDVLDPQSVLRVFGQKLYALDQSHGAMRVYDIGANFAGPHDSPLGKDPMVPAAMANPYDIYVDAQRNLAYVTLYGSFGSTAVDGTTALAVVDLASPDSGIARFISLPVAMGDADNNPEATRIAGCNDKIYVLLQDLDRTASYAPVGAGRLAVIDAAPPNNVSIVQLAGENPTALSILPGCGEALVGSAGNQLTGALSGKSGIERVNLSTMKSLGLAISDSTFGGNVSTVDAANSRDVFVAISSKNGASYENNVFVADAVSGTISQKVLGPINFVPQVRLLAEQLIVMSAGTPGDGQLPAGLYVGPATGEALSTTPILDLPPISADLFVR